MATKQKQRASIKNPNIAAVVNGLFRFQTKLQAENKLQEIQEKFETSTKLPGTKQNNTCKLWIKGFALTKEEKNKGFVGNYAAITIIESESNYTLKAEKLDIAIKYHPEQNYANKGFASWGFYALRKIKQKEEYETIQEAQKILAEIHKNFPTTTIPYNINRLLAMVYSPKTEVTKYIFEVKPTKEGKFFIEHQINKQPKKKDSGKESGEGQQGKKPVGYYTALMESKKKK